ncbi:MAG: hypothetical protein ACRDJ5_05700, partial [Actinomycetota bacterium]
LLGLALLTSLGQDVGAPPQAGRRERGGGGPEREHEGGRTTGAADAAPSGWTEYEDPAGGWTISHPPDWEVVPDPLGDGSATDFQDPSTGAYLRVDWTDEPSGADPVEAWEQQAQSFAAEHDGYEEITIEPTTYKGMDAAVWEFTYEEGGAQLHALDLGFVASDDFAGALFLNTASDDWDSYQDDLEAFQASFEPPR